MDTSKAQIEKLVYELNQHFAGNNSVFITQATSQTEPSIEEHPDGGCSFFYTYSISEPPLDWLKKKIVAGANINKSKQYRIAVRSVKITDDKTHITLSNYLMYSTHVVKKQTSTKPYDHFFGTNLT